MSPTSGGTTVKVLTGRSASGLQRYRDSVDDGKEQHLFATTRHCSHDAETQVREWKAVRELHGTQGATRAAKAKYETVDPETGIHANGRMGAHVKEYSGGRWRKRPVRDGEMPTHLRIEPEDLTLERESEATHTIYAAGADMVNPDDPESIERFWQAVNAERDEHYPGLQESRWLERNGESGLVHVHVASNATVYADFTVDGVDYKAGQKMGGDLTKVHSVRRRFEQYLDDHPEHELRQSLARVGSQEYAAAQTRDGQATYWEKKRGKETTQNRIRRESIEALNAGGVADRDRFIEEMKARGIDVSEVGLRRGKPGKNHDYSYRAQGAKQAVRGRTLGPEYSYDGIGAQLQLKAAGQEIGQSMQQQAGPAVPLPFEQRPMSIMDQVELDMLRGEIEELAQESRSTREPAERAADPAAEQLTVQEQLAALEADLRAQGAVFPEDEEKDETEPVVLERVEVAAAPSSAGSVMSPSAEPVFRSRLRGASARSGSERVQQRLDGLAQLEEDYHGKRPDAAYEQRIKAMVGVGPQLLRSYGEHMDPATREQLELRSEAGDAARAAFERGDFVRSSQLRETLAEGRYEAAADAGRAEPRREEMLGGQIPRGRHDLLVVDRGLETGQGRRMLDVQLDARDPAARGACGLHLARNKRAQEEHQTLAPYTPEQHQQIVDAAGSNMLEKRDESGRSVRVYGVRASTVDRLRGDGRALHADSLEQGRHPVDETWQQRQHSHEDRSREVRSGQRERQREAAREASRAVPVRSADSDRSL